MGFRFSLFFYLFCTFSGVLCLADGSAMVGMILFTVACSSKCIVDYAFLRKYAFSPLLFFLVSVSLISWSNAAIISYYESGFTLGAYRYAKPEFFSSAGAIWILGSTLTLLGMEIPIKSNGSGMSWKLHPGYYTTFLICSIFIVIVKVFVSTDFAGTIGSLLDLLPLSCILFFARLGTVENNKRYLFYSILLTVILTVYNMLYAYLRLEMILPSVVFGIGLLVGGARLKTILHPMYVPLYVLVIVFFTFFELFGSVRGGVSMGFNRITEIQQVGVQAALDKKKLTPFQRMSTISQISAVSNLVQEKGFYRGKASEPLLTAFVPRILWPEKPKIALGVWFALEIGEALKTRTWYNTSINMTIPGHLYIDFGWWGLIVGCFFVGRLLAFFWSESKFALEANNFLGTMFGTFLIYSCFLGIGADLQIIITMTAFYLLFVVIKKILPRKRENIVYRPSLER